MVARAEQISLFSLSKVNSAQRVRLPLSKLLAVTQNASTRCDASTSAIGGTRRRLGITFTLITQMTFWRAFAITAQSFGAIIVLVVL